jgi:autotransporter passenger strand-loop-strand repeat protein
LTTRIISSGVTSSNLTVSRGDELLVLSGGMTVETEVISGGTEDLSFGASADGVVVQSGGSLFGPGKLEGADYSYDAGTVSGVAVASGATEIVEAGGIAEGETILSGGTLERWTGAHTNGDVIRSGGALAFQGYVGDGQTLTDGAVGGARTFDGIALSSGAVVTVSNTTVASGGVLSLTADASVAEDVFVKSGGVLTGAGQLGGFRNYDQGLIRDVTVIGQLVVSSGGLAIGDVISGGEELNPGSVAFEDVVASGGFETVNGGAATGDVVMSGGFESVAGGTADSAVIRGGGTLFLGSGVIHTSGDLIESAGTLVFARNVQPGQTVTATGSAAATILLDGVTLAAGAILDAEFTTVLSGGVLSLTSTGRAGSFLTVSSGGVMIGPGEIIGLNYNNDYGLVSGADVVGDLFVNAGGVASGTIIGSGGAEYAESGGLASRNFVRNGGDLQVVPGGHAIGDVVSSGGIETLDQNTVTHADVVLSGGEMVLYGDADGSGDVISSGATLARGLVVSGQDVSDVASATAGGLVSGVTLSSAAFLAIADDVIVQSGGTLSLATGAPGPAFITVSQGGKLLGAGAFGSATDFGVTSGLVVTDLLLVRGHGAASRGVVASGGTLRIQAGAAVGTVVRSGGVETILSGGAATATVVSGYELDFGVASGTIIRSGGHERVGLLGVASGSVISNGGREVVLVDGVAATTTVSAGGTLAVLLGGRLSGGLTIEGGVALIAGTMASGQTVSFTGASGLLALENLSAFQARVAGLSATGQKIDLTGFAFSSGETVSWAQSGTSGTLTVRDGAKIARLTLVGTYATSDFDLATNGASGTYVTDPRAGGAAVVRREAAGFVQAMAVFGGRAARGVARVDSRDIGLTDVPSLVAAASSGR